MNLAKRQRLLLILAGSAIALLALDSLVATPLINSWRARSASIAKLSKDIAAGRALQARGERINRQWEEMRAAAFTKDASQAEESVLNAFDGWGKSSGAELGSIRPQWRRGTSDRYSLLECRVDASGSLSSLTRLLFELEKSPLPLRVDSLELSTRDEGGQRISMGLMVTGLRLAALEARP